MIPSRHLTVSCIYARLCASSVTLFFYSSADPRDLHSFPTRRSSDLRRPGAAGRPRPTSAPPREPGRGWRPGRRRSEEHTSELQSRGHVVCRLLLEKKKDVFFTPMSAADTL